MRRSILVGLFSLIPWSTLAAVEAPFAPITDVPDYVATFTSEETATPISKEKVLVRRTIYHHGAWTRIEREAGGTRSNTYINTEIPTSMTVDPAPGVFPKLAIASGPKPREENTRSKTSERDTVLGELCEIWQMGEIGDSKNYQRSCVTPDGIELWRRFTNQRRSGRELVAMERRAVSENDVLPPAHIFDWKTWSPPEPESGAASGTSDVLVILEPAADARPDQWTKRRNIRRHHAWTYIENIEGGGRRRASVDNHETRLHLRFEIHPNGKFASLVLYQLESDLPPRPLVPLKGREKETILGEECTWFDPSPGTMDVWPDDRRSCFERNRYRARKHGGNPDRNAHRTRACGTR